MPFTVYLGNLPPEATEADIRDVLAHFGEVLDIKLIYDPRTNHLKGYGFATYGDVDTALNAVQHLNGYNLIGYRLSISRVKPPAIPKKIPKQIKEYADQVADYLGEMDKTPRKQILLMVAACGFDFVRTLVEETVAIEEQGGLIVADGTRRRTPGGTFFYLARYRMSIAMRELIFWKQGHYPLNFPGLPFHWKERAPIIERLLAGKGEATSVRIKIIGQPGKMEVRKNLIIMTMEHVLKPPAMPKGVPTPPSQPTLYTIYISLKQWNRVAEALKNPADQMVLEGFCMYDGEAKGIAVFTSSITTKLLQQEMDAARYDDEEYIEEGMLEGLDDDGSMAPMKPSKGKKSVELPPEVVDEFGALLDMLAEAEHNLENLKAAGKQSGVFSAMQEIVKIKNQLDAMVKKYPDLRYL